MTEAKNEHNAWEEQLAAAAELTLALNPVVGVNLEDLASATKTTALQGIRHPLILVKHFSDCGHLFLLTRA